MVLPLSHGILEASSPAIVSKAAPYHHGSGSLMQARVGGFSYFSRARTVSVGLPALRSFSGVLGISYRVRLPGSGLHGINRRGRMGIQAALADLDMVMREDQEQILAHGETCNCSGTCLGSCERIQRVAKIIVEDPLIRQVEVVHNCSMLPAVRQRLCSTTGVSDTLFVALAKVPRILPAIILGVAFILCRRHGVALAAVETQKFVAGQAAQSGGGLLSREISRGGSGLLASAWTGLVAGGLHTLTGPDHLAALAPLCIGRSRLESFSVGALWGCGHDAGQMIFGLVFLLLKDRLHLDVIQTWAARVVGLTLITIGAVGIKEAQDIPQAVQAVAEGDQQTIDTNTTPGKKSVGPATFLTGIVYGLQPDALLMVLPALSLPSRVAGAAFLGMFLLGTVVAMGSYTAFVSSLSKALQKRVPWITHRLTVGSSLVAIGLGIAVLFGELFGINLF